MSWRSDLLDVPSSLSASRILDEAQLPGAGRFRLPGPTARNGRPAAGSQSFNEPGLARRCQGRRRSCLVRPWRSLAGLLSGLTLAAFLTGMPTADADVRTGPAGGEFTLQSVDGPVSLGDLRGKVVLLFFGYTSCPDICPLSLLRIGNCLSTLEAEQAERVSALFVTLDPGRDTPERMHQYAGFFHPGITGLTGDIEDIDQVTARYGITWARKSSPGSALGYSISHPDTILLVDADGVLAGEVRGEEGGEALRRKVLELLARRG